MVNSVTAHSLNEALQLRRNAELIPYVGGTDLMVEGHEDVSYLFLHKVPEMKKITVTDDSIAYGASCTFTEVIECPDTPAILREACQAIAAPAIRNGGSIGGNVGNGSPKADSALIFMVVNATLRLANADGERMLPIKEFYQGRKKLALLPDELIVEIIVPKSGLDNYYYKKIGAREALAISRVSFAGLLDVQGGVIKNCATAYGSVADVIIRPTEVDGMLIGKTIAEAKELKADYLKAMDEAIVPIRGRVSIEYRKDVCMNLLNDFLETNGI